MKALSSITKPLSSALMLFACVAPALAPAQAVWETVDSVTNAPDESQSFVDIAASAEVAISTPPIWYLPQMASPQQPGSAAVLTREVRGRRSQSSREA